MKLTIKQWERIIDAVWYGVVAAALVWLASLVV